MRGGPSAASRGAAASQSYGSDSIRLDRLRAIPDAAVVGALCLLLALRVLLATAQQSATFDEPTHLTAGYEYLTRADFRFNPEHPPFAKLLAAAPLWLADVKPPIVSSTWDATTQWTVAHRFLYEDNDADSLLLLARLGPLTLTLGLAVCVFIWTRQLFGRGAACLALFLFTFDPNLLAHAGLIATDVAASGLIFITVFAFYHLCHRFTWTRLVLTGVAFGLTLLTKFAGLWLAPTLGLLAACTLLLGGRQAPARWLRALGLLLSIGLLGYTILWAGYGFRFAASPTADSNHRQLWNTFQPRQAQMHAVLQRLERARVLPEAYLAGLSQLTSTLRRYCFLRGEISTEGWWEYFPTAFALKTPIPLQLLLVLAIVTLPGTLRRVGARAAAFIVVPIAVYFAIAMLSPMNIGHRHLLPIYPFLVVWLGGLAPWVSEKAQYAWRGYRPAQIAFASLPIWYLYGSLSIHPHYLAYFNELAGGPENGYRQLVDSNLDWGQDLKGLKRYMEANGIHKVWLSYFGMASPEYHGIDYDYLPSHYVLNPPYVDARLLHTDRLPLLRGNIAVSATNLQGVYLPVLGIDKDYFALYREQEPIAKIGYSIFVYRFD